VRRPNDWRSKGERRFKKKPTPFHAIFQEKKKEEKTTLHPSRVMGGHTPGKRTSILSSNKLGKEEGELVELHLVKREKGKSGYSYKYAAGGRKGKSSKNPLPSGREKKEQTKPNSLSEKRGEKKKFPGG